MAGGKGKSVGGGKAGGKSSTEVHTRTQQSHSDKAGLQVSSYSVSPFFPHEWKPKHTPPLNHRPSLSALLPPPPPPQQTFTRFYTRESFVHLADFFIFGFCLFYFF
jgi:hypothetical protein